MNAETFARRFMARCTLAEPTPNDLCFRLVQAVVADIDAYLARWQDDQRHALKTVQRAQNEGWGAGQVAFYTIEALDWQRLFDLRQRLAGLTEANAEAMLDDVLRCALGIGGVVKQVRGHLHVALNECLLWDTSTGYFMDWQSQWVGWLVERADALIAALTPDEFAE